MAFEELKQASDSYRALRGLPIKPRSPRIVELEGKIFKLNAEITEKRRLRAKDSELAPFLGQKAKLEAELVAELRKAP